VAPTYSILLPTHNRPETLEFAIRSVLAQTLDDWELLVVGDGCTDNTAAVVAGFGDARIRWFDLPKAPGYGYANRNIALREARGELVAFLGHDNLFLPDHLERMAVPFRKRQVQFAYSRQLWLRDDGLIIPFFVNLTLPDARREFMTVRNTLYANCVVHRRAALAEVGYWPEDVKNAGDWDLWKRIIGHYGPKCIHLTRPATTLHFRAFYREAGKWGPAPFRYLAARADAGAWWPPQLRLDLGEGLPQAQVWAMIAADGGAFQARLRTGADLAQDLLSWTAGLDASFR
jgi:glycosyltransferase involved in cell wall biosynthesis